MTYNCEHEHQQCGDDDGYDGNVAGVLYRLRFFDASITSCMITNGNFSCGLLKKR